MTAESLAAEFPSGLLDWAGHRGGGVRRLFHTSSGRPSGTVIETPLLKKLRDWADALVAGVAETPHVLLLVGGPGNGKTEAVENTILTIDEHLHRRGDLARALASQFTPTDGRPVPRLARASLGRLPGTSSEIELRIVQDASVTDPSEPGIQPPAVLVKDLESVCSSAGACVYLACINRGVLDDALTLTIDNSQNDVRRLLEKIIRSVALSPGAPACWPLDGYPHVAVWPMDVETLVGSRDQAENQDSPASRLFAIATRAERWPAKGSCPAGERCPYCISREMVSQQLPLASLLRILRWYELATGKRWSFRDLYSLVSYSLAGVAQPEGDKALGPCEWAARQLELINRTVSKPDLAKLRAPFLLLSAQYQHALFGRWPRLTGRWFKEDLRALRLEHQHTLQGLHAFLSSARGASVPGTLDAQLSGLSDALDPAIANPDTPFDTSTRNSVTLREVDAKFSQSVAEGLKFVRRHLSVLEIDVLVRLAEADQQLSEADVRRRRPLAARRLQSFARDFACRLVRRSLGVRFGVVREHRILEDFAKVLKGDDVLLHEVVKQVESLLNHNERFVVVLNKTFGEPPPPESWRAELSTGKQKVKPRPLPTPDRPPAAVRFLLVGSGATLQPIPLTYELFRSVRELKLGLLPASLPRPVVALLDTTRARLAGRVVRDEDALDGAEIRLGTRGDVVVRELGKFVVRQEEGE